MTLDDLLETAREVGFAHLDAIRTLARPAVALRPDMASEARALGSRLGGLPALPPSIAWPRHDERSLAFIAQIELATLPEAAFEQGFPREGLLLFFYDTERGAWGCDPKDAGSFAVVHVPQPDAVRTDWPVDLPERARYPDCGLIPEEILALPPWESVLIDDLGLDRAQLDAYLSIFKNAFGDDGWAIRGLLGGYPDQIQGDMMQECEQMSAGVCWGDATASQDLAFRRQAREWRLLLQVPSVESAGMNWGGGDPGCLYYSIRESDLRARRFERCWITLQCWN
jgi:uncharacterized protein YwqG